MDDNKVIRLMEKMKGKFFILGMFVLASVIILANFASAEVNTSQNNESNYTAEYDSAIIDAFEELNQTWVRVIVRLVDNSGINITGTKEQRRNLSRQVDIWFSPVVDDVVASLSEDEFEMNSRRFNGFSGLTTQEGFEKLINDPRVEAIYKNRIVSAALDTSVPLINANDVWNLGYTGDGVKICVIDTGVNATHPNLQGKIIDEYCYCATSDSVIGSADCCPDGSEQSDDAEDNNGHGTHVVGIIASQNNTYKGVAPNAEFLSSRQPFLS